MKCSDITLAPEQIEYLRSFKKSGKKSKREYDRANILLLLHKKKKNPLDIKKTNVSLG